MNLINKNNRTPGETAAMAKAVKLGVEELGRVLGNTLNCAVDGLEHQHDANQTLHETSNNRHSVGG